MSYVFEWVAPVLALCLVGAWSSALAQDTEPAKGTVSVTVQDKEKSPVSDAMVRLMSVTSKTADRAAKPGQGAEGDKPKAEGDKPKTDGARIAPAAEGKTGADGKVELSVAPGEYMVMAMVRDKGRGQARVTVKAGEPSEVTVTLEAAKTPGGDGGAAGAEAGREKPKTKP